MRVMLKILAVAAGLTLGAGAAQAQAGAGAGPGAGAGVLVGSEAMDARPGSERSADAIRDEAMANAKARGKPKSARAVPAKPEDIVAGEEVRDSKGVVIGKVESVAMVDAVIASDSGKVAVPLEAFGKNNKGLLLGMTKAEFDAAVAAAVKPAG